MSAEVLTAALLGPPTLRWRGAKVAPPSQKHRAVLYYLAIRATPASRTELAELLWGPGRLHNVRQALTSLRQLPGSEGWLTAADPVALSVDADTATFERAVGRRDHAAAVRLWRGDPLEGFGVEDAPAFTEWLEVETRRFQGLLRDALRGRATELHGRGRTAAALEHLRRLLELDPLDESAHRTVMRLEFARGHVQAALAQFELCRRALHEELGIDPLAETRSLATLITEGALTPSPHGRPGRMPPQLLRPPVLVGREREWEAMERAWNAGQAIVITGPPGVGKSRLMLDFAHTRGRYLLNEGRPTDRSVAYSSLTRGLRLALSRFPELPLEPWVRSTLALIAPRAFPDGAPAEPGGGSTAQLIEAWLALILALQECVDALPADDVHEFDRASAEISEAVNVRMSRDAPRSWRHLGAFREDAMAAPVLENILRGADLGLTAVIRLQPLGPAAVERFLAGLELPGVEGMAEELRGYTGGNPTYLIEVIKDLFRRGRLQPGSATFELPSRVSTLIDRRLEALEPRHLRLLRAAAVLQPECTVGLLASVVERPPMEVADDLGALEAQQFLQGERFAHDLLCEAVLDHMPAAIAHLLHRRAARCVAAEGGDSARVAYHLEAADAPAEAVPHWLEAARRYAAAGLHASAIAPLEKAMEHADAAATRHTARLELARALLESGRATEAAEHAREVSRASLSPTLRLRALDVLARGQLADEELEAARATADAGLTLAADLRDTGPERSLLLSKARILRRSRRQGEALDILAAVAAAPREERSDVLDWSIIDELAGLQWSAGRLDDALALRYRALELADALGTPRLQLEATRRLMDALLELGRTAEAIALGEAAQRLCPHPHCDALRLSLADAYLRLGRRQEADELRALVARRGAGAGPRSGATPRSAGSPPPPDDHER